MNYQKLIDEIIIMAQEEKTVIETVNIEKNATVEGRTGEYDVDLLWEFFYNSNKYKIIIDFKNINKQLPQNELFNFVNLTNDVSGFVTGVTFTKPVYNKIIQNVAKDAGIFLYEVDFAEEIIAKPHISNVKIDIDKEWVAAVKKENGLENENIKTSSDPKHLFIYDAAGNCLESLEAIFNKYIKEAEHKDGSSENINHTFAEDMFLTTNHHIIDKIKIKSVNFDLEFISAPQYDPQEIIRNIANFAVGKSLN